MASVLPWLGTLISNLLSFVGIQIAAKASLMAATTVLLVAMATAFVTAIHALFSSIAVSVPTELSTLMLFIPDNVPTCLGVLISARLTRAAYDFNKNIVQLYAQAK